MRCRASLGAEPHDASRNGADAGVTEPAPHPADAWAALDWRSLETTVQAAVRGAEGDPAITCAGTCDRAVFVAAARFLHQHSGRLLTLSARRDGEQDIALTYTFEVGHNGSVTLRVVTADSHLDSLFSLYSCADFLEREVNTLFGVKFLGHPNLSHVEGAPRPGESR